jgi:hypothetical protein
MLPQLRFEANFCAFFNEASGARYERDGIGRVAAPLVVSVPFGLARRANDHVIAFR